MSWRGWGLVHVKRDDKGRLLHWHPCLYFHDHECSQDPEHLIEKDYRKKEGLTPLNW